MTTTTPPAPVETTWPGALIGHTSRGPIYLVAGGDGETAAEPDGDGEDGEEPADEWQPPSREEVERLQARLKSANKESASRRRWLEEHGIDSRTGQRPADPSDGQTTPAQPAEPPAPVVDKAAIKQAATKAAADVELRLKPKLQRLAAGRVLDEAGVLPEFRTLVMAQLDLSDIDVDEDGNPTGHEEQVAELKTKYPNCFAKKRTTAARTTGADAVDGGSRPAPPPKEKRGWLDHIGAQMDGTARRG